MRGGWFCALGALVLLQCKVDDGSGASVNPMVRSPMGATGSAAKPMMAAGSGGQVAPPAMSTGSAGMPSGAAGTSGNPVAGAGGAPAMTGTGGTPVVNHGPPPIDAGMMQMDAGHDADVPVGDGETGRLVGITAAHNAVRAMVDTAMPLAPLMWSTQLAQYAQQWSDALAMECDPQNPRHRSAQELQQKNYGENLAESISTFGPPMTDAQWAVSGWAAEKMCWTYGTINDPFRGGGTEKCDVSCYTNLSSDGCGHYTQIVWRDSTEVGCGFSTCMAGSEYVEIWICNYAPAGNFVGHAPY